MASIDILWQIVILLSQLQLAPFLQVPAHFEWADDEAFRPASLLVHVIICSPPISTHIPPIAVAAPVTSKATGILSLHTVIGRRIEYRRGRDYEVQNTMSDRFK